MTNYRLFNVSGMITLRRDRVSGIAVAVQPDRSGKDTVVNFDYSEAPIDELGEGDSVIVLFTAKINQGSAPEIALHQIGKEIGAPDLINEPALHDAIEELLSKF